MTCEVCGRTSFRNEQVSKAFSIENKLVLVEGIPAEICNHCGEANFDAQVAEQVRHLVRDPHQPARVVPTEVLQFHAA
jgi:YgiT-type zinc finger domain-containing protein